MISAQQLRAARAHLDLSQDDVAAAAGITKYTLSNIERGATDGSARSLEALQQFYENHGVQFTDNNGIKAVQSDVRSYEGAMGLNAFMMDVIETMEKNPGTYCVSNVDENNWLKWQGIETATMMRDRIAKIKGLRAHILVKEGGPEIFATGYAEYRALPADLFYDNTSYYVYADKMAIIQFTPDNVIVRVLHNRHFAESFKLMFYRFWDMMAKPVKHHQEKVKRYA
jgi:transcriptional regulator with XRE-family HTH domain